VLLLLLLLLLYIADFGDSVTMFELCAAPHQPLQ
jgi:hypothetical protein